MFLYVKRTINHPAYEIAVSQDNKRIAISGNRKIYVFSWPEMDLLEECSVPHTDKMMFLEDNKSIFVINTLGKAFLWEGNQVENVGKFPVLEWISYPIGYAEKDCIIGAERGNLWKYDVRKREINIIYSNAKDAIRICRCEKGVVSFLVGEFFCDGQTLDLIKMTYNGEIIQKGQAKNVHVRCFEKPAWSDDDLIAIVAIAPPFTVGNLGPKELLYFFDSEGTVLKQEKIAMEDSGDFFYGNNLFFKINTFAHDVSYYNAKTLEQVGRIPKEVFDPKNTINPVSCIHCMPDGKVLIGTWEKLFVFDIE